nr:hypothetical protein [Tanacetum cinerariifolium]
MPKKMKDPGLFILPCRLEDSKPFDTLADLRLCVNLIPLYLFKTLNIGLLKEIDNVLGLTDGTKAYHIGIIRNVEVILDEEKPRMGVGLQEIWVREMDEGVAEKVYREADLFLSSDNLIPPGIENFAYDSEGDIRFLEALLSDDSILFPNNESSGSDFDNPSFPQPPPEPPDAEFEPDSGEEISVVMNTFDELECLDPRNKIDENDDYFPFMFVIRIFLPYLIYSDVFLLFLSVKSEDTIFDPGIFV